MGMSKGLTFTGTGLAVHLSTKTGSTLSAYLVDSVMIFSKVFDPAKRANELGYAKAIVVGCCGGLVTK